MTEQCFDTDGNPLDGSSEEGEAMDIAEQDEWPAWTWAKAANTPTSASK